MFLCSVMKMTKKKIFKKENKKILFILNKLSLQTNLNYTNLLTYEPRFRK